MIPFHEFTLTNGLRVIVHEDHAVPIAVMNILYDVGSRDEQTSKTGFAHLFEHLMFGGSVNVPNYDEPLQKVGGENNAFTNTDITNYYLTVPAANIETGFWLESDRMLSLSFDPKVLEVQRKVVIEEFKQRYLTQPYGDVWLKLRPLAYKSHPYQWATIGKEISHIENATMEDVKEFFFGHYVPNNAIMVVAGNVTLDQVKNLSEKWFGPIPAGARQTRSLPVEPPQKLKRTISVEAEVPADALYKAYHMPGRFHADYYAVDLMSDILSRGHSSRFYDQLVKKKEIFNSISSFTTSTIDPGLLVFNGRVKEGIRLEDAEVEVDRIVQELVTNGVSEEELEKVKNQAEAVLEFGEVEVINRAMNLAFAALSGDADLVNKEKEQMRSVSALQIKRVASENLEGGKFQCDVLSVKERSTETEAIMKIRVGFGFDVHPLAEGRNFWLGGVLIPSDKGAVGHSDADVLIHALCDALLGAANLRDIGFHYSNNDPRWEGMDSKFFLKDVTRMLSERGWKIENVDCTLTLEKPKVNPFIPAMKEVLAPLMNVTSEEISIKATTNELMGYVGRGEGVNASAVALISNSNG